MSQHIAMVDMEAINKMKDGKKKITFWTLLKK